jgi:hypothetical protein
MLYFFKRAVDSTPDNGLDGSAIISG